MSLRPVSVVALAFAVAGCPQGAEVTEAACAPICAAATAKDNAPATDGSAAPDGVELSEFEEQMLGKLVADIRTGVAPIDDQSLGICPKGENKRKCETSLGANPGELGEGEYILYSSWKVPNVGDKGTWTVKVDIECTTTRVGDDGSESTDTRNWTKSYDVSYAGRDRGYTLSPLRVIKSPNPTGAQVCAYTITAPHPDGDKVYEGGWSIPQGEPAE